MGIVYSSASMSFDGYIAYEDDNPGALFDWYDAGDIELPTAMENLTFHLTPESAAYVRGLTSRLGALVVGRRLFDITDGWNGRHPYDVPVVVLTHDDRPRHWNYSGTNFHFVADGITSAVAVARSLAGDLDVSVAAGEMASQALESGLLDEVRVDLVPVILGSGRPYFTGGDTWRLGDPTTRIEAKRVTHLVYPVHR
jgi:dihydrofolate reductase